jgi:CBS domain containing-hemolysin-like protein
MAVVDIAVLVSCCAGAFFFAGSETGFISWNPLKLTYRARQGSLMARWALYLMRRKARVVSAVLIGNNACVVGASLAFLYLYVRLDEVLPLNLGWIKSPESWFLSPLLVVFGEMLPKSLFRIYSFKLTMKATPALMCAYWITFPFSWALGSLGSWPRKVRPQDESYRTKVREEMLLVAKEGVRRGTIFENANVLINGVLTLKGKTAADAAVALDGAAGPVLRADDTIGSAREKLRGAQDAAAVLDCSGGEPVGWISVLDVSGELDSGASILAIMRPLEPLDAGAALLSCLKGAGRRDVRFRKLVDHRGRTVGLFDRSGFLRMAFEGLVPRGAA